METIILDHKNISEFYCNQLTSYSENELRHLIKWGNTKLPNTTAIFNMGTATGCPAAKLGLCEFRTTCKFKAVKKNKCYAIHPENFRPNVKKYRLRQMKYWLNVSAEKFAYEFIQVYNHKVIKPTLLRFNEAGELWGQNCVTKLEQISKLIFDATGVKSYIYTHRTDLKLPVNSKYLNVVHSGKDNNNYSSETATELIKRLNKPIVRYIGVTKQEYEYIKRNRLILNKNNVYPNFKKYICIGDCKKCNLCAMLLSGEIYAKIH